MELEQLLQIGNMSLAEIERDVCLLLIQMSTFHHWVFPTFKIQHNAGVSVWVGK